MNNCYKYECFNPRAREGRDINNAVSAILWRGFNPRAREGRDKGERLPVSAVRVSIHAPARGATV